MKKKQKLGRLVEGHVRDYANETLQDYLSQPVERARKQGGLFDLDGLIVLTSGERVGFEVKQQVHRLSGTAICDFSHDADRLALLVSMGVLDYGYVVVHCAGFLAQEAEVLDFRNTDTSRVKVVTVAAFTCLLVGEYQVIRKGKVTHTKGKRAQQWRLCWDKWDTKGSPFDL